jgi:hypothetical protein
MPELLAVAETPGGQSLVGSDDDPAVMHDRPDHWRDLDDVFSAASVKGPANQAPGDRYLPV